MSYPPHHNQQRIGITPRKMLKDKKNIRENTPEWMIEGSREMLRRMNYDVDKNIHEQFIERYGESMDAIPVKKRRGRPKKSLPSNNN